MRHKRQIFILVPILVTTLLVTGYIYFKKSNKHEVKSIVINNSSVESTSPESTDNTETIAPEPAEVEPKTTTNTEKPPVKQPWPITYSTDEASSLTVVVNKKHKLPNNYSPIVVSVSGGQMRQEAATAMSQLLSDSEKLGIGMKIISSYRSYNTQVSTYQKWVNIQGQAEADRGSARPGHSEHQTGLAADLGNLDGSCNLLACFGSGTQGTWLASNAHLYGYIIRYPEGKESLTGYQYEPWHVRYVGVDTAIAIYQSGLTMDQYYGVEAGDY